MKKTTRILSFVMALCMLLSVTSFAMANDDNTLDVQLNVEVESLDPQVATDGTSFDVIAATVEGLYMKDADGAPIPALAKETVESEDGLTYEFTLQDATWSNGTPITAGDFVYAWERLVDPEFASEYSFMASIACIKNADAVLAGEKPVTDLGVTAIDDKTLKVELEIPVPFFLSLLSFPSFFPGNQAFHEEVGDSFGTSPETYLSCGPFALNDYEPAATTISLVKNPNYYDAENVKIDGINFYVIKDAQQAMMAYGNGDLELSKLTGEQIELYEDDPAFTNVMAGYLWYLSPNTTVAGLENVNIRKAMSMSYSRDDIAYSILKDGSIPFGYCVPTMLAANPEDGTDFSENATPVIDTDKEKALEYWNMGLEELGVSELTYTLIYEDTESASNIAQFIAQEIMDSLPGLTINLQSMPKKNRVENMQDGNYQIGLTRWGPDYADPMTYLDMWTKDSPNNYGFWENAEYNEIILSCKKGDLATKPAERWLALKDAAAIAINDVVIMPVYQKGDAYMMDSNVSGISFYSVGVNRSFKNCVINAE